MAWSSVNGTSLPMTAGRLEKALFSGRQSVEAAGEDRLNRLGNLDPAGRGGEAVRTPNRPQGYRLR
jgi:hypothetical protein